MEEKIIAYKGFNTDLTCRGFQYEVGKTFEHEGDIEACYAEFHACEHPLNVFYYYPPATSRYALVEMSGKISRESNGDTKIASAEITIKAEMKIPDLVAAAIKYVFDRAKWTDGSVATGRNAAAQASGYQGAAQASGYQGAAQASGYQGAAQASGYQGAAQASGYQGAAQASGYQGAATASGTRGKVKGSEGSALFLVERVEDYGSKDHGMIVHVWAGIVGVSGIEPDTYYTLKNGIPVKV